MGASTETEPEPKLKPAPEPLPMPDIAACACAAGVASVGARNVARSESTRAERTSASAEIRSARNSERQRELERPHGADGLEWRGVEAADEDDSGSSGFSEAVFSGE